jgi:hypothetical protein
VQGGIRKRRVKTVLDGLMLRGMLVMLLGCSHVDAHGRHSLTVAAVSFFYWLY